MPKTSKKKTVLHYAVEANNPDAIKALMNQDDDEIKKLILELPKNRLNQPSHAMLVELEKLIAKPKDQTNIDLVAIQLESMKNRAVREFGSNRYSKLKLKQKGQKKALHTNIRLHQRQLDRLDAQEIVQKDSLSYRDLETIAKGDDKTILTAMNKLNASESNIRIPDAFVNRFRTVPIDDKTHSNILHFQQQLIDDRITEIQKSKRYSKNELEKLQQQSNQVKEAIQTQNQEIRNIKQEYDKNELARQSAFTDDIKRQKMKLKQQMKGKREKAFSIDRSRQEENLKRKLKEQTKSKKDRKQKAKETRGTAAESKSPAITMNLRSPVNPKPTKILKLPSGTSGSRKK